MLLGGPPEEARPEDLPPVELAAEEVGVRQRAQRGVAP